MSSFSPEELRQAALALDVIDRCGDPDEFTHVLAKATAETPSADLWQNVAIGARIAGGVLARRLSSLLGEPFEQCEAAAAEVFGRSRQRATYSAILSYAAELAATSEIPKSDSPPKAIQAVTQIRLISGEGAGND